MAPELAWADILSPIKDTDIAGRIVSAVMPVDGSPLTFSMSIVLGALTLIGSTILTWHVISGVIHTAYQGKVLGTRWHQIYAPLRVVLGYALIIPVTSAGYCGIQLLLSALILTPAINIANVATQASTKYIVRDANPFVPSTRVGRSLVPIVLEKEACAAIRNSYLQAVDPDAKVPELPPVNGRYQETVIDRTWPIPDEKQTVHTWDYGAGCGAYQFTVPENYPEYSYEQSVVTGKLVKRIRDDIGGPLQHWLRDNSSKVEVNDIDSYIAAASAIGLPNALGMYLDQRATEWNKAVTKVASDYVASRTPDEREKIEKFVEDYGFFSLAVIDQFLAQTSAAVTDLTSSAPVVQPTTPGDTWEPNFEKIKGMLDQLAKRDEIQINSNDLASAGDAESGILVRTLSRPLRDWWESVAPIDPKDEDPQGTLISNGVNLQLGAWAVIGAGSLLGFANTPVGGFVISLGVAMLAAGIMLGIILPILSLLAAIATLLIWTLLIITAYIVLPLGCMNLIRMDGEEFFEASHRPMLMLLLNLLIRPAMATVAILGVHTLIPLLFNVLDLVWMLGTLGSTGGQTNFLIGPVIYVVLNWWIKWNILVRAYAMTYTIPDRVGAIIGGDTSSGFGDREEAHNTMMGGIGIARQTNQSLTPQIKPMGRGKASAKA